MNLAICRRIVLTLFCFAMGFSRATAAPEQKATQLQARHQKAPGTRPRIGIAFEGGGALGFAHIGVIEWLEEHHIPVDYISGTSMGGLVGGFYASGMTPDEITEFVNNIDWSAMLNGRVPFTDLSFRRKEDRLAFPTRLEFGLKNGLSLPGGLNSGARVGLLLDRVMLPYWDLESFDDLPIPFRCVATEITRGERHVFDSGSLSQALRASMSIPGMFAPVHHGNEIYSDGGALDNLPVDVARSMGADVVIASYLDSGPPDPGSLGSLFGVAGRNVSIMVEANVAKSLKDADIVITSDVSKFGAFDFPRSSEIIPIGTKAAAAMSEKLEKYALNDADWAAYVKQRQARRRTKVPIPQFVEVYGISGREQAEVRHAFEGYAGKPIDPDAIERRARDLLGVGVFSTINYNVIERNGKPGLLIRPRLQDHAPPFLNIGITISANESNDVRLGLQARATFINLAGPGSEVRLTGMVEQMAGINGELFKPLWNGSHFFVAPRGYLQHELRFYYQGSIQLEEYRQRRNGSGADLGYQFNSRTELRAGMDYQRFQVYRTVGTAAAQEFSLTPVLPSMRFQYLGQDDEMVPTRGNITRAAYEYSTKQPSGSGGYSQMTGRVTQFIPLSDRSTLFGIGEGGTSFGASNLGLAGFTLGGPLRLSAFGQDELLGTDYFLAQAGFHYRLLRVNPVFTGALYAGGMYEIGKMYGANPQTPSLPNSGTGFLVMKTPVGPLFGGLSIGDSGHRKWFFGLGPIF